jgi:hypothetical protein
VAKQGNTGEKWPLNFADEHLSCSKGSFTCRKSTTWDRPLYFPSEGRRIFAYCLVFIDTVIYAYVQIFIILFIYLGPTSVCLNSTIS